MMRRQSRTNQQTDTPSAATTSEPNVTGYRCGECHKSFSRPENLARHRRATHTRENRYQCRECSKRFTRSDLLKKHTKIHRTDTSEFGRNPAQIESSNISNIATSSAPGLASGIPSQHSDTYGNAEGNVHHQNLTHIAQQEHIASGSEPEVSNVLYPMHASADIGYDNDYQGYGEGLYDADLTWTFDYVSSDMQGPVSTVINEGITSIANYDHNLHSMFSEPIGFPSSAEGDSQQDWPDGQSRPVTPGAADKTSHLSLVTYVEPREFDEIQQNNRTVPSKCISFTSANVDHVSSILLEPELLPFCGPCPRQNELPDPNAAKHFLLLYLLYVHPRFPIVHIPSFTVQNSAPELLLSMILAGSCYSPSNRGKLCRTYIERARMAITLQREKDSNYLKSVENLYALFILSLTAIWTGQTEVYRRGESDRGMLISACRRSRLLDGRKVSSRPSAQPIPYGKARLLYTWRQWIEAEQRKRLGLAIYILDCQFAALLQRQPYISKAETTNTVLPCQSMYWEAPTAEAWKILLGTADSPPCFYHLPTLSNILLRKELDGALWLPSIEDFGKTFYIYVLHTHIFEWRQAMCMLNTTGLKESPVSLVHEAPGYGLLDRQRWLLGALETWNEAYGQGDTISNNPTDQNAGGIILYHLGHLALSINFSDLYVAAGRSGSLDDVLLAAESLRNRLSTDTTYSIMKHVSQMLKAAFQVVQNNNVQLHAYEVTVGLFMGGLIYWAIHHTLQQQELSDYMTGIRGQFSPNTTIAFIGSPSHAADERTMLVNQINRVIDALKSVHCLGFSSIFASVLAKLITSNAPSKHGS